MLRKVIITLGAQVVATFYLPKSDSAGRPNYFLTLNITLFWQMPLSSQTTHKICKLNAEGKMYLFSNNTAAAKQCTFELLKVSFFFIFSNSWSQLFKRWILNAIHWIHVNLYPLDSATGFPNTYPVDSNLSSG